MEGQHGPVAEVAPHTGFAQDSTIIEADSGAPTEEDLQRRKEIEEKKKGEEDGVRSSATTTATAAVVKTKPRGEGEAKTTRSRDGTWTKKKHGRSFFGYKLHTKDELGSGFIVDIEVTTASVHDNNVDLTRKGEVCVRDRAYTDGKGLCINMVRATRGNPLTKEDKELNKFLSKVRAPVEHPFAVIKRIFHGGRVLVTTAKRVNVRMTFVCTCYNLFRALTLAQQ